MEQSDDLLQELSRYVQIRRAYRVCISVKRRPQKRTNLSTKDNPKYLSSMLENDLRKRTASLQRNGQLETSSEVYH